MKLQRTFICIAGMSFAVGFAASQAAAGTGVPGCGTQPDGEGNGFLEIEVNALRAGGKTIVTSPNDTTKVTAKARILKGTAPSNTTMVTGLVIEAVTGGLVIGQGSASNITLGVGKGGKGATVTVPTESCADDGFLKFIATFTGVDGDNDLCEGTREINKACR